jgi:hypothetical protein
MPPIFTTTPILVFAAAGIANEAINASTQTPLTSFEVIVIDLLPLFK